MSTILVTGGTGTLGRVLVPRLAAAGHEVRVLSRRPRPAPAGTEPQSGAEPQAWVVGDLRRNEGLGLAVAGAQVIVHCASANRGDDVAAANLIRAARQAGTPHLVYISIVGVDRIPLRYYRTKLATERLIADSGLPWTVLRTTQFHDLVYRVCVSAARLPLLPVLADTSFQPLDAGEVAARLAELAMGEPAGRAADMGGPEVRTARDLVHGYLRAAGRRRVLMPVWLPGGTGAGFRRGDHLAPGHAVGRVTFETFLHRRLGQPAPR